MLHEIGAIPPRPLEHTDIERLRSRPDVRSLISLGTTTVHQPPPRRPDPTRRIVMLTGTTVSKLEYDGADWSSEVLETDADRRDHLQCALDQLHEP